MGNSAITGINLGVPAFQQDFTSGTSLVVNHNLNSQFVSVTVYDENDIVIIPDNVTATDANTTTVDVSSFTVAATWRVVVIDKGATVQTNAFANDLNISGQATDDRLYYNGSIWTRKQASYFAVRAPGTQTNLDPAGGDIKIDLTSENLDNGDDFTSNEFTAPVTGIYQLNAIFTLLDVDTAADYFCEIFTTKRPYGHQVSADFAIDAPSHSWAFSVTADIDVGQKTYLTINQVGGTQQTDVSAGTYFSGHLIA